MKGNFSAWMYVVLGMVFGLLGIVAIPTTHDYITRVETQGGSITMPSLLVSVYELGGKWLVILVLVLIFASLCILFTGYGLAQLRRQYLIWRDNERYRKRKEGK